MFVQSVGDILRFSGQLFFRNKGAQVSDNTSECLGIFFLRHRVAQMPEIKQALELTQQPDSKLLIGDLRQRGQEFDVPDQMGQAELLKRAGIFDVGRKEVADECALKTFTEDFLQDLGATGSF